MPLSAEDENLALLAEAAARVDTSRPSSALLYVAASSSHGGGGAASKTAGTAATTAGGGGCGAELSSVSPILPPSPFMRVPSGVFDPVVAAKAAARAAARELAAAAATGTGSAAAAAAIDADGDGDYDPRTTSTPPPRPATGAASPSSSDACDVRVMVASMNVGNAALNPAELAGWLKYGDGCEIVAVALQESISYSSHSSAGSDGADAAAAAAAAAACAGAASDSSDSDSDNDDHNGGYSLVGDLNNTPSDGDGGGSGDEVSVGEKLTWKQKAKAKLRSKRDKLKKKLGSKADGLVQVLQVKEDKVTKLIAAHLNQCAPGPDGGGAGSGGAGAADAGGPGALGTVDAACDGTALSSAGSAVGTAAHATEAAAAGGGGGGGRRNLYKLSSRQTRGEMQLLVFTRSVPTYPVHSVESAAENTGFNTKFGHLPNKGGLVTKLTVGTTDLCFIGCHLAAHEGGKYLAARNASVEEILSGARVGDTTIDPAVQFHHCFVFGDLNYRSDVEVVPVGGHTHPAIQTMKLPGPLPKASKKHKKAEVKAHKRAIHAVKFGAVFKVLKDGRDGMKHLYAYDELAAGLAAEDVLVGFQTPMPEFAPTFKVTKGDPQQTIHGQSLMAYNLARTPSWCDRVVWKSLPGSRDRIQLESYDSVETVTTSDHKPIRAIFAVSPESFIKSAKEDSISVLLSKISANIGLADDVGTKHKVESSKVDASIVVTASPTYVLAGSAQDKVETSFTARGIVLVWNDQLVVNINSSTSKGIHLFLTVKMGSRGMGTAVLELQTLEKGVAALSKMPIVRNGLNVGELSVLCAIGGKLMRKDSMLPASF